MVQASDRSTQIARYIPAKSAAQREIAITNRAALETTPMLRIRNVLNLMVAFLDSGSGI
jgi:hypothetical protein